MGWQHQELEPRSPAPPLPQEHKEVIAGSTAFTLGMAPTVTHTLPAWSISDLRNTVPTPLPPSRISPHPEVTHYLLGLFENPVCLCA